jgi:preprotein translocase subunit SecG
MTLLHISLLIVFIFICFLLISSVLLQTGKGGGMAGLGGGSSDSAFGAHTANILQKFTMWCVIAFFGLVVVLAHMTKQNDDGASVMDNFTPAPKANTENKQSSTETKAAPTPVAIEKTATEPQSTTDTP